VTILSTSNLTRSYGKLVALNNVTLEIPKSGVIGLVGPNGSGKSTLIRILLGLVKPTSGTAHVLGHTLAETSAYAAKVGALIENPAFIPTLSARKNLLTLAQLRGVPSTRIGEVLETVGLTGRDKEPVKRFSLGMKQRLGIAAALLTDPQLLILDEPTNGLDPSGIVEIRALLQKLAAAGKTVIVSSHLLSEIEAACDPIV
jgi:ABC-2 type transport system ATP-binding protein